MINVECALAWRYLRPARREGFVSVITAFSVLGIALGVATLILVTSLMNGIRAEMTSRFIGIEGHITVESVDGMISIFNEDLLNLLTGLDKVTAVIPKVTGQVMASHRARAVGAWAVAIPDEALRDGSVPPLREAISDALLDRLKAKEGVIIGDRLARSLRLNPGDTITLLSPDGRATAIGMIPRIKSYTVLGTITLGMHLYDSTLVLMPYDEGRLFFKYLSNLLDHFQLIDLMLERDEDTQAVTETLREKLGDTYYVENWQTRNASVFEALTIQRNVMVVILGLIVLVAAFNIIASLIMLVQDKAADIAILRTMGATRRSVMSAFCLSGTMIGAIGTLLGLGLGLLAANNLEAIKRAVETVIGQELLVGEIYFLSTLPTKTDPFEVAVIILLSLGLSFLATLYPAWRAASVNPSEALRYE